MHLGAFLSFEHKTLGRLACLQSASSLCALLLPSAPRLRRPIRLWVSRSSLATVSNARFDPLEAAQRSRRAFETPLISSSETQVIATRLLLQRSGHVDERRGGLPQSAHLALRRYVERVPTASEHRSSQPLHPVAVCHGLSEDGLLGGTGLVVIGTLHDVELCRHSDSASSGQSEP